MACAGLNIILVSMLTVKFLADNAKAKAGRKVIEEDVRRSIHFRSSANFSRPVSCTLSDRSNYCITWDMRQMQMLGVASPPVHTIYTPGKQITSM